MQEFHWMFGERVRTVRKVLAGLNQAEMGAELGISRQTVNAYERDRQKPSVAMIESICTKYNVAPVWLLTGEGNMQERQYPQHDPDASAGTPEQKALVRFIYADAERAAKLTKILMEGGLNSL